MADKKFVVKNGLQSEGRVLVNKTTDNNTDNVQVDGTIQVTGQVKSTVSSGTAPFSVSSVDRVQNLNADLLDGQEGSYYQNASNIDAGTLASARLPDLEVGDFAAGAVTIESEGIANNDSDNNFPTSAAVKDYVDTNSDLYTSWTISDGSATQAIASGNTLTVSGTSNEVDVAVSATDTLTIGLPNDVTIANDLTIGSTGKIKGPPTFYIDPAGDNDTSGTVIIQGSLTVQGTTTTINSNEIDIGDNIIRLNSDLASDAAPTQNAGLLVERGSSTDVQFIWNETSDKWQVTEDGTNFYSLLNANDTLFTVSDGSNTTSLTSGDTATFEAASGELTVAESGGTVAYSLADTGVSAGTVGSASAVPILTIDAKGRITSTSTATIGTGFTLSGDSGSDDAVAGGEIITFSGTTGEITTAISDNTVTFALPDDVTIGQHLTVSNELRQGEHVHLSETLTTTSTTQTPLVTNFSATTYASAEVNVVAVRGSSRHLTKLLVTHDGTNAYATEFGEVLTGSALATYDVDINAGNVRILVTPDSTTSTKFQTALVLSKN